MSAKEARLSATKKVEKRKKAMLKRELEWIRSNAKGGQSKGKARGAIVIPPAPRLGGNLLTARNLGHTFDVGLPTEQHLFSDLGFELTRGQRIGVIGPNGVGKTTLMRILAGELQPQKGAVALGPTVQLGFVSQSRDSLDPKSSVYAEISQGKDSIEIDGRAINMRAYVASFNLRGEAQEKKIGALSGGERNRVHLAKELQKRSNVLFLDEPTNVHVDTLRSLEEALATYEGCLIMISHFFFFKYFSKIHDRWFLNRLCTDIIAFDGQGKVEFHRGNYESYLELRSRRGDDDIETRSTKFRPLNL
eukprot:GSMAST32.ASY1.ANO1.588.1 assembled CDS